MLLLRKIFILSVLIITVSCGFAPVYSKKGYVTDAPDVLASVEVETNGGRFGQIFQNRLEDVINPYGKIVEKRYKLLVDLKEADNALAIQQDSTITRYKTTITGSYTITDSMDNNKLIDSGTIKRDGGYDKVDSDYATFVSQRQSFERLSKDLADDFKMLLMARLFDTRG